MVLEHEKRGGFLYDFVGRLRPDGRLKGKWERMSSEKLRNASRLELIETSRAPRQIKGCSSKRGRCNVPIPHDYRPDVVVGDQFALLRRVDAPAYFAAVHGFQLCVPPPCMERYCHVRGEDFGTAPKHSFHTGIFNRLKWGAPPECVLMHWLRGVHKVPMLGREQLHKVNISFVRSDLSVRHVHGVWF